MIAAVQQLEPPDTDPGPGSDLALTGRVAAGDESALREFYERFADPLFAFVSHSLNGNRSETEEVWQDTLSTAVRGLAGYRGESRLFSWLCSIARHKVADYARRHRGFREKVSLLPPEELGRLMDTGSMPDEIASRHALCRRVLEVLGDLPDDYRQALTARYAEGRTVEEVAALLNKSYKATESVLTRARESFRVCLAAQEEMES